VTKATRRLVYEKLADAEFSEAELTYAKNMLEKQAPERVLALLLRMAEPPLPREPADVPPTEPRAWAPTNGARPSALPPRPRNGSSTGYTRFLISWGARHGANAARCMSHVCRRGGITRHAVGAIDIGEETSSVEVSDEFAAEFERRCRRPDPRDKHVHITLQGAAPPRHSAPPPERHDGRGFAPHGSRSAPPPGPRVKRAARGPRGPAVSHGGPQDGARRGPKSRGPALASD
jgi:ATP-dependent RNA helicase DeaD